MIVSVKTTAEKVGQSLLNLLINKIPIELESPGYQFCENGTKLKECLLRGDIGINPWNEACKIYHIAYSQTENISEYHKTDEILEQAASSRFKSLNFSIG